MTTNGSTYYEERQKTSENNIKRWQDWSYSINYVVEQFNDVIANLTERLDMAETTIDALTTRINLGDGNYVKLQYSSLEIGSSDKKSYTKTFGLYSNVSTNIPSGKNWPTNTVYVYSDKSVDGLYINNSLVQLRTEIINDTVYYEPFLSLSGSESGTIIKIKSDGASKIGGNINLYFSLDASMNELSVPTNDDYTAKLSLKINYSSVIVKELITLDKSKLSQTIVNNSVMPAELRPIDKIGVYNGQYSTTKTAANAAAKKTKNQ